MTATRVTQMPRIVVGTGAPETRVTQMVRIVVGTVAPAPEPPPLSCGYDSFVGDYDADWRAIFEGGEIIPHVAIICLDPGGMDIQLTGWVETGSGVGPVRLRRDVKFREYQGGDVEISFIDPDGYLDPEIPGGLFEGVDDWHGLKVAIGSWLRGTERVLRHAVYYLEEIYVEEGATKFRCLDAFGRFAGIKLKANYIADIEASSASTTGALAADGGLCNPTFAPIESWTVTFTGATTFEVKGSKTGPDGSGNTGSDFVSDSGALSLFAAGWSGTWAAEDTVTFKAVLSSGPPADPGSGNLFTLGRDLLITGAGLDASLAQVISTDDFDAASWTLAALQFRRHVGAWIQRDPIDALSFLRLVARHGPATAYPDGEGKIALAWFQPSAASLLDAVICGTYDLFGLKSERILPYTSVSVTIGQPGHEIVRSWPRGVPGTTPLEISLPGFDVNDQSIVDFIAQYYYIALSVRREIFTVDLSLADLNRRLEDVVHLRSVRPNRVGYGLVVGIDLDLTGHDISARVMEADWLVQPPGSCGYLIFDIGHRWDDCWVLF